MQLKSALQRFEIRWSEPLACAEERRFQEVYTNDRQMRQATRDYTWASGGFVTYVAYNVDIMSLVRIVYVSDQTHRRLKLLAARRSRTMGELVEELVEQEAAELGNVWTSPEGLAIQQQALAKIWEDPSLDVYNKD